MSRIYIGWPGLDALSELLFGRKLSLRWTGPTSASDNVFDGVHRLLEVYATVCDHEDEVGATVGSPSGRAMHEDLMRLSDMLASTSEMFDRASKSMEKLAHIGKS